MAIFERQALRSEVLPNILATDFRKKMRGPQCCPWYEIELNLQKKIEPRPRLLLFALTRDSKMNCFRGLHPKRDPRPIFFQNEKTLSSQNTDSTQIKTTSKQILLEALIG